MDFARKQLEKYGWSEGKGLGKEENGIQNPVKVKPRSRQIGLGHNLGEEFTDHWWQKAYNDAANNITVNDDGEVKTFSAKHERKSKKKKKGTELSSKFIMGATLTNGIEENTSPSISVECTLNDEDKTTIKSCTDEELFIACGSRTAHKGARHGLKSNGKLMRIKRQEKLLLKKYAEANKISR